MTDLSQIPADQLMQAAGFAGGGGGLSDAPAADLFKAAGLTPPSAGPAAPFSRPMPSATDALAGRIPMIAGTTPGSSGDIANFVLGGLRDFGHNLLTGAMRGAGGALGLVDGPSPNLTTGPDGKIAPADDHQMRNLEGRATDAAFNVIPPYMPKTAAGRITQAAGGGLLAAPAGPLAVGLGLLGGGGGQAAGELTNNNPWATIPATVLPMLLPGVMMARRGALGDAIRSRTEGMPPQAWDAAQALQDRSYASGLPLMATEAMDSPELQQLTSHAIASTGGPAISQFTAQRPGQVRSLVNNDILDQISIKPETTNKTAASVQGAAEKAIQTAEQERSAETSPFYQAAATDEVPADQVRGFVTQLDKLIAADPGNLNPSLRQARSALVKRGAIDAVQPTRGQYVDGAYQPATAGSPAVPLEPFTDIETLDRARKILRDKVQLPPTAADALGKTASSETGGTLGDLRDAMTRASPNFGQGRALHEQISQDVVNPLAKSDIGTLADRAGIPENRGIQSQVNTIANPSTARPEQIRFVANHLNMADRSAFPALARTYFENAFDTVTAPNQPGDNPKMGFSFAKAVNGTDQQRANNIAVLEGVAQAHNLPASGLQAGFDNAMEILERTGRIPGIGSQTTPRAATNAELASGPGTGFTRFQLDKPSTYPLINKIGSLGDMYMSRAYRQFAETITTPGGVQKLRELALLGPSSRRAQLIVGELAGLNATRSQEQQ